MNRSDFHTALCRLSLAILCLSMVTPAAAQSSNENLFEILNPQTGHYHHIRVARVESTDTIILDTDETVCLIGLKALPAPAHDHIQRDQFGFVIDTNRPYDSLEEQAMTFVRDLVEGAWIRLEFDAQKRGPGNVLLAYIYREDTGVLVNAEILKHGFASLSLSAPNTRLAPILREAYQEARREQRGIHGE